MSAWGWAWLAWALLFMVIELPAAWLSYHGRPGGTLSELFWRLTRGSGRGVRAWRMVAVAGFAVLLVHLFTGWI